MVDFYSNRMRVIRANSLNLIVGIMSINYYLLHHFAVKTFSPEAFASDNGWGSVWTIMLIIAGQCCALYMMLNSTRKSEAMEWGFLFYIYQVYCYREADLHNISPKWPDMTSIRFYTQSSAPFEYKTAGIIVLSLFVMAACFLLFKYGRDIFISFRKGEPFAVAFGLWAGCLVTSQVLDRCRFFNYNPVPIIKNIEEMLELTAAIFALLAITQYMYRRFRISG